MTDRPPNRGEPTDEMARVRAEMRGMLLEIYRHTLPSDLNFESGVDFYVAIAEHERSLITTALRITAGNQKEAARLLRLGTSTLCTKIKTLDIDLSNFRERRRAK